MAKAKNYPNGWRPLAKRQQSRVDQLHDMINDVRSIKATGQGIGRIPAKGSNPHKIPKHAETHAPRVYTGRALQAKSDQSFVVYGLRDAVVVDPKADQIVEHFDVAASQTEIDMSQYRTLAKHERALLSELDAILGKPAPRHRPSPFGEDRFRKFDPSPAFEDQFKNLFRYIGR